MPTALARSPASIRSVPPNDPPAIASAPGSLLHAVTNSARPQEPPRRHIPPSSRAIGVTCSSVTGESLVKMAPIMMRPVIINKFESPSCEFTTCASPITPSALGTLITCAFLAESVLRKTCCITRAVWSQPTPGRCRRKQRQGFRSRRRPAASREAEIKPKPRIRSTSHGPADLPPHHGAHSTLRA